MKVFERALMVGSNLYLFTSPTEVETSERKKKLGTEGCPWEEGFADRFLKPGEWITNGGWLRAGVSAAVLFKAPDGVTRVILNQFDAGHPTVPLHWSLPAGLWDNDLSLKDAALAELGQEVILLTPDGVCRMWQYHDEPLQPAWVRKYAEEHDLLWKGCKGVKVEDMDSVSDCYDIHVDGIYMGKALLAAEPETGSIEFIFLFRAVTTESRIHLADGEYHNGWLHRQVGVYTRDHIEKGRLSGGLITSKVQAILDLMRKNNL